MTKAGPPRDTSPDPIGWGADARIFSGCASNFVRQPAEQKKYSFPLCTTSKRAVAVFTAIPQTGSFDLAGGGAACGLSWRLMWSVACLLAVYIDSGVTVTAYNRRTSLGVHPSTSPLRLAPGVRKPSHAREG